MDGSELNSFDVLNEYFNLEALILSISEAPNEPQSYNN